MMNANMNKPDQADLLAAFERVAADLESAKSQLSAAVSERDAAKAELADVTAKLQNTISALEKAHSDNAILQAQVQDFNKAVAEAVAKAGIANQAATPVAQPSRAMTWTEKCLAARG